jgi:hypothetical protein
MRVIHSFSRGLLSSDSNPLLELPAEWQLVMARKPRETRISMEELIYSIDKYYPLTQKMEEQNISQNELLWALLQAYKLHNFIPRLHIFSLSDRDIRKVMARGERTLHLRNWERRKALRRLTLIALTLYSNYGDGDHLELPNAIRIIEASKIVQHNVRTVQLYEKTMEYWAKDHLTLPINFISWYGNQEEFGSFYQDVRLWNLIGLAEDNSFWEDKINLYQIFIRKS